MQPGQINTQKLDKTGEYVEIEGTKNHAAHLQSIGYKVEVFDHAIMVEVAEFVAELDLREDPKKVLAALVKAKKALTYKSRIHFAHGTFYNIRACGQLDKIIPGLSCIVMHDIRAEQAKETPPSARPSLSLKDFLGL